MHNATSFPSLSILSTSLCHDDKSLTGVMFLYNVSNFLSLFFLFLHSSSLLLVKLLTFLHHKALSKRGLDDHDNVSHQEQKFEPVTSGDLYTKEDLVADVLGGETLLFLREESAKGDTLRLDQVEDSKDVVFLDEEDSTIISEESTYYSPQEDLAQDQRLSLEHDEVVTVTNVLPSSDSEDFTLEENVHPIIEEKKDSSEDERPISLKTFHPRSEKFHLEDVPEGRESYYGESLTGESTSKSSTEWRSSTIFRDSETEYPFSSSSRRSSSRWESYTVFPKYNEGMVFLDRISAQKLSETESLRSIKVHPRSISERICHKLSTKPKSYAMGRRDPYQELESAYAAQICLAWEALSWNYENFRQKNSKNIDEGLGCPARIAQEFQQFQVLLQRFIENEPYEFGKRPEVYARRRMSSPKLLHVPEFRDSEGDEGKDSNESSNISSVEFLVLLEECIRTFMKFLKADKEKCGDKIKSFIKRKSISVDPIFLRFLKKSNRRKKMKIIDIGRRRKCIRRRKLAEEEEMKILMGLIDLKIVSRVLRMDGISNEQLHWCEEKMSRVRVGDGKMQRDSSPLFFPVH
ncbi:uncharacterized protein LOC109845345 [Asparagus officinalis]|uniref:uncharacterized protein LOC109845345 n=1 Tax=Asparagus officinalis TaxID=4686 RepID=UPI00098E5530|nr:uncharacterized protein LOC109845345 [Asparagus officinalis]